MQNQTKDFKNIKQHRVLKMLTGTVPLQSVSQTMSKTSFKKQLDKLEESNENDKAISKSRLASSSPLSLDLPPPDSLKDIQSA